MSTLFHGQSSVEHRFTVNNQFFIVNLKEKPLIALRWAEEHVSTSVNPQRSSNHYRYVALRQSRQSKVDLYQQRQEKENERKSLMCKIVDDETSK